MRCSGQFYRPFAFAAHQRLGEFEAFVSANTEHLCRNATQDRGSNGSQTAAPTKSFGQNATAATSAALARRMAKELKSSSPSSLPPNGEQQGDPNEALVTDILVDYLQERGPKVVAKERMSYAVLALCGYFEGKTVAEIDVDKYTDWRARGAGTVRRELGVLRAAVNHAHRKGRLHQQVAKLIRATKTPQARLYMPLFILLAVYTGRRKQALLSLRWCDVDLVNRTMDFDQSRARTNKRRGKIRIPTGCCPI